MKRIFSNVLLLALVTMSFIIVGGGTSYAGETGAEFDSNAVTGFYQGKEEKHEQVPNPPVTGTTSLPPDTGGATKKYIPQSGAQPTNEAAFGVVLLLFTGFIFYRTSGRKDGSSTWHFLP